MVTTFMILTLASYFYLMSTALIIIFSVIGVAFYIFEGIICGKICAELIHKKNPELNEVLWFWLGFLFSWVSLLLTLIVKPEKTDKE